MFARNIALSVVIAACAQQAYSQTPAGAPAGITEVPGIGSARGSPNESRRDSIRSLPLNIRITDETGISLPPPEPEKPETRNSDRVGPEGSKEAGTSVPGKKRDK